MFEENLDMESIAEARRNAVKQTLRPASLEELKALGEEIFPFQDDTWREIYFRFIKENAGNTFYRASAGDEIEVIYCPAAEKGMWFIPEKGLGPLQERGLQIMKEVVQEAKHL